jgi:hypothetical protein
LIVLRMRFVTTRKSARYTPREMRVRFDMYRVVRSFSKRFIERVEHTWASGSECAAMVEEWRRETWTELGCDYEKPRMSRVWEVYLSREHEHDDLGCHMPPPRFKFRGPFPSHLHTRGRRLEGPVPRGT